MLLTIRVDANKRIGSGHAMRCISYADAARGRGHGVMFAVSDGESAGFLGRRGWDARVLPGDCSRLGGADGERLARLAVSTGSDAVLVDSYAVSCEFFGSLRAGFAGNVGYVDDQFSFEMGRLERPLAWGVSSVVNYGFAARLDSYESVYGPHGARLLVGPAYAPVRKEFIGRGYRASRRVEAVLVTCGATNPGGALERMARGCVQALPGARVIVVVGPMADFDEAAMPGGHVELHRGVSDMSSLMLQVDAAVSAAGSTLYELAALGVPTVAAPIVENQLANAEGIAEQEAALSLRDVQWCAEDVALLVSELAGSAGLREGLSRRAQQLVDGKGPDRVIGALEAC